MYYAGRVHTVIFEDPPQAFYILKVVLDYYDGIPPDVVADGMKVTVRGYIPGLAMQMGTWFGFEANWSNHAEYGKQLAVTKAPIFKDVWEPDTLEKILISRGVGSRTLALIRHHVGDEGFSKALGDKETLEKVPGVDTFTALFIVQRWQAAQAYFRTLDFLGDLKLPAGKVRQVWAVFGDDAEKVLSSNPWALVRVDGINFSQADSIAMRLGLDMSVPDRVSGAVLYAVKEQKSMGHLYLTTGQLFAEVSSLIPGVKAEVFAETLAAHHKAETLVLDRNTRPGVTAVYEPWWWKIEKDSADLTRSRQKTAGFGKGGLDVKKYLQRLRSAGPKTEAEAKKKKAALSSVVEKAVEEWGESAHITLSPAQEKGACNALMEPVSILTGLPGTGKTTSLRAVVRILQDSGVTFLLCAPTGIAAKNLSALTGAPAYTIHRAFSAKGVSEEKREATYTGVVGDIEARGSDSDKDAEWGYDEENTHPAEVVIVDESSMLDQHLLYRLLTCTSPQCRLVIVGDAAQLPSVGPGNVLRDLIGTGLFPVVDLREIFRQKDTSDIVFAAHAIFRGEVPEAQEKSDFSLVPIAGEEQVLSFILQLAQRMYEKRVNFQILSPRHAGPVGVTNLNARLRELLNPRKSGLIEMRIGEDTIREDDRVMVIKNEYNLGVFNGDVGKVVRIDRKAKEVEIKIFGEPPLHVLVPFKKVGSLLRLAYACTVHKAQGLEYDCIVMPLVESFSRQLQRNLLYTAVTRAKKKVVLVGSMTALGLAVANDKEDQRNTLFRDRLVPRSFIKEAQNGVVEVKEAQSG